LTNYELLIQKFPQSTEAAEAISVIRDIEGRPNDYVELMKRNGMAISVNEADSLTYTSALVKFNNNDCNAAITAFGKYLSTYPGGNYSLDAAYLQGTCYQKNKAWAEAVKAYEFVNSK